MLTLAEFTWTSSKVYTVVITWGSKEKVYFSYCVVYEVSLQISSDIKKGNILTD